MEKHGAPLYEYPKLPVYYLPERLCFTETPELRDLRAEVVPAMVERREGWIELKEAYEELCERQVEDCADDNRTFTHMRVGADIIIATLQRDAGRMPEYIEDLQIILDDVDAFIVGGYEELNLLADILTEELHDEEYRLGLQSQP